MVFLNLIFIIYLSVHFQGKELEFYLRKIKTKKGK